MDQKLQSDIEQVVRSAGATLLKYWPGGDAEHELGVQKKSDGSIVTAGDFASNEVLIDGLKRHFPNDAFYSEEGDGLTDSAAESVWVIDPLDGTKYFAKGTAGFCIVVARVTHGLSRYGVCYFPVQDVYAAGSLSQGTTITGKKTGVSTKHDVNTSRVYVKNIKCSHEAFFQDTTMHPAFHLFDLCSGKIDGAIVKLQKHQEWDLAPYVPLLLGAGGMVSDENGNEPKFHFGKPLFKYLVGSNGHIHQQLLALL